MQPNTFMFQYTGRPSLTNLAVSDRDAFPVFVYSCTAAATPPSLINAAGNSSSAPPAAFSPPIAAGGRSADSSGHSSQGRHSNMSIDDEQQLRRFLGGGVGGGGGPAEFLGGSPVGGVQWRAGLPVQNAPRVDARPWVPVDPALVCYSWFFSLHLCYGVATISRLLQITGLFCNRAP